MLTESKKKFDKTVSEDMYSETKIIKTTDVLKSHEITCVESPDLSVSLKYPVSASPGETLGDYLAVTVSNKGPVPAKNFAVELVLSSDNQIPCKKSTYRESFQEDVMLKVARRPLATQLGCGPEQCPRSPATRLRCGQSGRRIGHHSPRPVCTAVTGVQRLSNTSSTPRKNFDQNGKNRPDEKKIALTTDPHR